MGRLDGFCRRPKTKQQQEIEEYIKDELDLLRNYYIYAIYTSPDEKHLYTLKGCGYTIYFYEYNKYYRLAAGFSSYANIRYVIYGFIQLRGDTLEELKLIDRVREKLSLYVDRRERNNENNNQRN